MDWKDVRAVLSNLQRDEFAKSTGSLARAITFLGDEVFGEEPAKSDFQVGDCVRTPDGRLGLVAEVCSNRIYRIRKTNGADNWWGAENLTLIAHAKGDS